MYYLQPSQWAIILTSYLMAFLLTILPLPSWAVWFRPDWVLMVVIFWVLSVPTRINLGTAWLMGFILDGLSGSVLGQHALALTLVTYLVVKFQQRLQFFPLWQQAILVGLLDVFYKSVILLVQGFVGELSYNGLVWLSCFMTLLLWPWLFIVMRDLRLAFKIS